MDWKEYFKNILNSVSLKSKDKRKVGALIVGPHNEIRSTGFNGIPRNCIDLEDRYNIKPNKYFYIEHAERNAIYQSAFSGTSTKDCILYCTMFPCCDCTRAIIQSGIIQIITNKPDFNDIYWGEQFKLSIQMLQEANIIIDYF